MLLRGCRTAYYYLYTREIASDFHVLINLQIVITLWSGKVTG